MQEEITAKRLAAGGVALLLGWYATTVLRAQIRFHDFDAVGIYFVGISTGLALCLGSFALWGHRPAAQRVFRYMAIGGGATGGIGFAAGFFGPMLFSTSGQGPLLGVIVTAPIGLLAGAVLGGIYGIVRRSA